MKINEEYHSSNEDEPIEISPLEKALNDNGSALTHVEKEAAIIGSNVAVGSFGKATKDIAIGV